MPRQEYVRYSSIPKMLEATANRVPNKKALVFFEGDLIKGITFKEYLHRANLIGAALHQLGINPKTNIGIYSETRYEWCIINMGILMINACTVTYFHTLESDQVKFIADDSDSEALFISNQKLLEKVLKNWKELPKLQWIFIIDDIQPDISGFFEDNEKEEYSKKIVTYKKLLEMGENELKNAPTLVQEITDAIQETEFSYYYLYQWNDRDSKRSHAFT